MRVTLKDEAGNIIFTGSIDAFTSPNSYEFIGFISSIPIKTLFLDTTDGGLENEAIFEIVLQQGPRFTPQEKQVFRKMAILMATGGFSSALVGTFCAFIPESIFTKACALIASGFATSASYGAFLANQAANDPPDPNFTVIDQPVIPSLPSLSVEPGVTQEMADAWSALSGNLTQVIGFWRALITAVERAQGAAEVGNVFWETLQLRAAAKSASQLATLHSTQPTLRTNMQSALQNAGFPSIPITASDLSQFQSDILANGLPSSLTDLLTQLGADSTTPEDIESLLIAQDPSDAAGSFPEILTNLLLNASFQEVAHALGEFALSTPSPISGDLDRDGVPDSEDVCPNSNLEASIIIDGCDSGVTEHLDADGCIISDLIADCVDDARNHGQFVREHSVILTPHREAFYNREKRFHPPIGKDSPGAVLRLSR